MNITRIRTNLAAKLFVTGLTMLLLSTAAAWATLLNPSFESGTGTDADNWTEFNNGLRSGSQARTGSNSLQTFGFGDNSVSGAFQDVAALPGQFWSLSGYGLTLSTDTVGGGNYGKLRLEFLDSGFGFLGAFDSAIQITSASPTDTWIFMSVGGTAPAGTAYARAVPTFVDPLGESGVGSVFFDDLDLTGVPEPAVLGLLVLGGWMLRAARRRARG